MLERPESGLLIVVEGIDGAGKTTQARMLVEALRGAGLEVVASREPTQGRWGQQIRATVASGQRMPVEQELAAFLADRREHQEQVIVPALAAGQAVVLDRYFYSTIAYQGIRVADVGAIEAQVRAAALSPDSAFVLDIDPEAAAVRIRLRDGVPNVFERLGDQIAVRAIFKRMARQPDLIEIPAEIPAEDLHRALMQRLSEGPLRGRLCARAEA